jgi:hypothetical protein
MPWIARMKSKLFVRPNLKLFLLGAILIALVHDLALNGPMEASGLTYTPGLSKLTEQDLQKFILLAEKNTDPELFMRISYAFEKRGEPKKALLYLRKAERCSPVED